MMQVSVLALCQKDEVKYLFLSKKRKSINLGQRKRVCAVSRQVFIKDLFRFYPPLKSGDVSLR